MSKEASDLRYEMYQSSEKNRIKTGAILRRAAIKHPTLSKRIKKKLMTHGFWGLSEVDLVVIRQTFTNRDFSPLYEYLDDVVADYHDIYKHLEERAMHYAANSRSPQQKQLARQIIANNGLLEAAREARTKKTTFRQWVNLGEALQLTCDALEQPHNKKIIEDYKRLNRRLDGGVFLNNKVAAAVEIFCGLLILFATLPIVAFAIVASPPAIIGGMLTAVLGAALIVSGYHFYKHDKQLAEKNQYPALSTSCRFFYRTLKRPQKAERQAHTRYKMKTA